MTNDIKMEDLTETASVSEQETTQETEVATEQDPLKTELEKVRSKGEGRTQLEKAIYRRSLLDKEIKELGGETAEIEIEDDEKPLTVGMLKKIQQENASKSALQLTDEIPNEAERELTKYHLQNTIKSTGNPSEDLKLARAIVNSVKNTQIAEEIQRKASVKSHSSSTSAPAKHEEQGAELTQDELTMMKWSGITKEEVLKARR